MSSSSKVSKKIIIDTNVILFDALAVNKFRGADVYIPFTVIEEIDRFKKDLGENGRNARHFSRFIDVLRGKGSLSKGVQVDDNDSYLFVISDHDVSEMPVDVRDKADNRILSTAIQLRDRFPEAPVELISKDINLRIKADVLGIEASDYRPEDEVFSDDLYSGYLNIDVEQSLIDEFYEKRLLKLPKVKFFSNQYVILKDQSNPNHSAIGRYNAGDEGVVPLVHNPDGVWGIQPRNVEQNFAFDALLNDEVLFVSLVGKAGTGKTMLALAAGLHKTADEGQYQRLLVSRPIFPMGRDIGYLPGDVEQKLNPWMQPIFDNVEFLMGSDKRAGARAEELINQGMMNIEPLTYIRGRSIPNQYLIVDEAQNLTPHEIKTIVTRCGEGTKVVLTGDVRQIDNPYVDAANSGLTYSVERFKPENLAAHISLAKGERSELAELAANIL